MTQYTSTCGIMAMSLLYRLDDMVKCVFVYGSWIQWLFMAGVTLIGDHYRTNIINDVEHLRLDSVVPLVLCTVVYNIRGIGVV